MLQASNKCIVLYSKSKDKDRYSDHVFNSARVSFGALGDFKKVPNNRTVKACIDCHSIPSRKVLIGLSRMKIGCGAGGSTRRITICTMLNPDWISKLWKGNRVLTSVCGCADSAGGTSW